MQPTTVVIMFLLQASVMDQCAPLYKVVCQIQPHQPVSHPTVGQHQCPVFWLENVNQQLALPSQTV